MKTLIVITGPTGVGKSDVAMEIASILDTHILSADSRQIYKDIPIITAAPTPEQKARVPHHFAGILPLDAYFSAALFESEAMSTLTALYKDHDTVIVCGGSMMYVDALCNGIDNIPTVTPEVRTRVAHMAATMPNEALLERLRQLDPEYYAIVDHHNIKRVCHAIEICLQSGTTFSSFRTGNRIKRPFRIHKFLLTAPRTVLFERINTRVTHMIDTGAMQEAERVYPYRHLNSLNTVGCKELFEVIAGRWDLPFAIARLQKNTRVYAKKQITWYSRDNDVIQIDTTQYSSPQAIAQHIISLTSVKQ